MGSKYRSHFPRVPEFVQLLQRHRIDVVADVRSQPYSNYTTQFNAEQIKPALAEAGIRHVFLGQQLGGRPEDPQFYDAEVLKCGTSAAMVDCRARRMWTGNRAKATRGSNSCLKN